MPETSERLRSRKRDGLVDGWLLGALVTLTIVNFTAADQHRALRGWWIVLILGVAFAKAVAIGLRYMRLGAAPRPLWLVFLGWAVAFFLMTTVLGSR